MMQVEQRLQEALERAAQLQWARTQAELDSQAKTDLLVATAHDIRQPLLALRLCAQQLQAWLRDPPQVSVLDAINSGLNAMDALTSDLLDRSRTAPGGTPQPLESVCLRGVYARLVPQLAPMAVDKGLRLRWRGGAGAVWGHPLMIERALRNLVTNAIQYTDAGGVLVGARRSGRGMVVQVWDSGCGLQPSDQVRVFEDHYRTRPDGAPGYGLGLGIVRQLCDAMGARVTLRSWPGKGSVFELHFRACSDSGAPAARRPRHPVAPPESGGLRGGDDQLGW